jgi:hypothetical protein
MLIPGSEYRVTQRAFNYGPATAISGSVYSNNILRIQAAQFLITGLGLTETLRPSTLGSGGIVTHRTP